MEGIADRNLHHDLRTPQRMLQMQRAGLPDQRHGILVQEVIALAFLNFEVTELPILANHRRQ
jgi:hypothetical protein